MFWRLLLLLGLVFVLPANTHAAPTLEVSPIFSNGVVDWTVTLLPDPNLPPPGGTGTISAEVGFDFGFLTRLQGITVGPDLSVSAVPAGHNPFDPLDTSGSYVEFGGDNAFVSATGEYSSTDESLVLATLSTRYFGSLAIGGQTLLPETPDEFIGARITQNGMVFDGVTGFVGHPLTTFDANVDGTVNGDDIPDFITALLDVSDWQAFHPRQEPLFYLDGNFDGLVNNDDIPPFVLALRNPPFLTHPTAVPEPGSVVLLFLGSAAVFCFTQRLRRGC